MKARLLSLVLASGSLVACGGSTPKPTAPAGGGAGSGAATPTDPAKPDGEPSKPPARTPEQMAADALARVPAIAQAVAGMRNLTVADIPAAMQSQADFRAFVEGEMKDEASKRDLAATSRALTALGLLAEDIDLASAGTEAVVTQAAAYYDPKTKQFKVVVMPGSDQEFDMVSAHELMHGVQDQHFDLQAYLPATLNDDAASARKFVVEGEATFMMIAYLLAQTGANPLKAPVLAKVGAQLKGFAALSAEDIAGMMSGNAEAAAAMAKLPPYVLAPMFDSYMKGAVGVYTVFAAGGWPAVDALYKTPPTSTEQLLHPVEKLACHREEPVAISIPATAAGKGWTSIADGVAGEHGVGIYGQVWKLPTGAAMAAGWGGDAWRVFSRATQAKGAAEVAKLETLALWATAWDSDADATEFADGMKASLATRGVKGSVVAKGSRVDVALGCDGKACDAPLKALAKLHPKQAAKPVTLTAEETACIAQFATAAPATAAP